MSAWITMIDDADADRELLDALALARTPHGTVDNVMRAHSLRPATLRGHVALYRAVLHDDTNTLAPWLQETIGAYVSMLNDCPYSLANHWTNARHLIGDDARAHRIEASLRARRPGDALDGAELALLRYAEKLTLTPGEMDRSDIDALRAAGSTTAESSRPTRSSATSTTSIVASTASGSPPRATWSATTPKREEHPSARRRRPQPVAGLRRTGERRSGTDRPRRSADGLVRSRCSTGGSDRSEAARHLRRPPPGGRPGQSTRSGGGGRGPIPLLRRVLLPHGRPG